MKQLPAHRRYRWACGPGKLPGTCLAGGRHPRKVVSGLWGRAAWKSDPPQAPGACSQRAGPGLLPPGPWAHCHPWLRLNPAWALTLQPLTPPALLLPRRPTRGPGRPWRPRPPRSRPGRGGEEVWKVPQRAPWGAAAEVGLAAPLPSVGCGGRDGGPGIPRWAVVRASDSKLRGQLGLGAACDQPGHSPALGLGAVPQMWPPPGRQAEAGTSDTRVWAHVLRHISARPGSGSHTAGALPAVPTPVLSHLTSGTHGDRPGDGGLGPVLPLGLPPAPGRASLSPPAEAARPLPGALFLLEERPRPGCRANLCQETQPHEPQRWVCPVGSLWGQGPPPPRRAPGLLLLRQRGLGAGSGADTGCPGSPDTPWTLNSAKRPPGCTVPSCTRSCLRHRRAWGQGTVPGCPQLPGRGPAPAPLVPPSVSPVVCAGTRHPAAGRLGRRGY